MYSETYGEDIDSLTDFITEYINIYEKNTIPTKTVWCFSNNKPWLKNNRHKSPSEEEEESL